MEGDLPYWLRFFFFLILSTIRWLALVNLIGARNGSSRSNTLIQIRSDRRKPKVNSYLVLSVDSGEGTLEFGDLLTCVVIRFVPTTVIPT